MKDSGKALVVYTILNGLFFMSFSSFKTNENNMETTVEKISDGAAVYEKHHSQFRYYIETVGEVNIDKVTLKDGHLTAIYSYRQGRQIRNVVSELIIDHDGIYKGTCTTKVDGSVLFAVNTWLNFNADGSAKGNWSWSGAPTQNDPVVEISKK